MTEVKDYKLIFSESYKRILETGSYSGDFLDDFYRRFLASSSEVASKFGKTDMTNQREMLKQSLYQMLMFLTDKQSTEYLEKMAVRHSRKGIDIPPRLYDLWLECLIGAVRDYDSQFSDDVELAWRLVMAPGIVYMKYKYDHV